MENLSIETILEGIRTRDSGVLSYIYNRYYPFIRKHVLYNSGNEDDAMDVFQEAMVVLFRKHKDGNLNIDINFRNYLIGIAKMLWLKELERRKHNPVRSLEFSVDEDIPEQMEEWSDEKSRFQLYQKSFLQLAEDCQKILKWFYSKVPLLEIARRMGFKSENYAKKRKFMCKEKLIEIIKNDPSFSRDD